MRSGLTYSDCWDLTPSEILYNIREKNRQIKDEVREKFIYNYQLASMVSNFVNLQMTGKSIPSAEEMAPNLFGKNKFKEEHNGMNQNDYNRAMLARDQFLDFAKRRNQKLKEGKTDVN